VQCSTGGVGLTGAFIVQEFQVGVSHDYLHRHCRSVQERKDVVASASATDEPLEIMLTDEVF